MGGKNLKYMLMVGECVSPICKLKLSTGEQHKTMTYPKGKTKRN